MINNIIVEPPGGICEGCQKKKADGCPYPEPPRMYVRAGECPFNQTIFKVSPKKKVNPIKASKRKNG